MPSRLLLCGPEGVKEQQEQKIELIYLVDRANTCDSIRAIAHRNWMVKCFLALREFTQSNKHNAPTSNSRMEKEIHYVLTRQITEKIPTGNLKTVSFLLP